jgi:hypothetical protein
MVLHPAVSRVPAAGLNDRDVEVLVSDAWKAAEPREKASWKASAAETADPAAGRGTGGSEGACDALPM